MNKKRLTLRFAVLAGILVPLAALAAPEDSRLGSVYLEQARALYDAGAVDSAARLLRTCIEFSPDSSEALYLLGILVARTQAGTREGMRLLTGAISSGTWTETDPDTARLVLARAELRTGRLAEAVPALTALASRRPEDPQVALLLAASSLASGKLGKAAAETAAAIKRFPREEGLYLLSTRVSLLQGDTAAARKAASAGLRELPDSLSLALRAAELEPERHRRVAAIDAYVARGGADALAPIIAMEAGPKGPAKYLSLFLSRGGLSRLELTRRAAMVAAGSDALASRLRQELSRYTGTADLDTDGEGFWGERWEYAVGQPVRWSRDMDRDGVPELVIDFKEGVPSTLILPERQPGAEAAGEGAPERFPAAGPVVFHFDDYPFLDSVSEAMPGGTRTWFLSPRALGCPVLEGSARVDPADPRVPMRFSTPTVVQVRLAAFRVEERTAANGLVRKTDLRDGRPEYAEEDTDGDGVLDHKLWYVAGRPDRGVRDLDGSGTFPVSETYRNGVLWRMTADLDRDGFPEYAEEHDGGKVVKLWDYNGSGTYDAREHATGKGTVVREFSTGFDGRFDLRVTGRNGEISGVEKDGRALPVSRDSATGITWIGTRPANAAAPLTVRDGPLVIGGRGYLAFRFGGSLYLEELK